MLTQAVRHGGLGTVGDHLHGIEQVLASGGELAKAGLFGSLLDPDVPGRLLALFLQSIEVVLRDFDLLGFATVAAAGSGAAAR
jgi:hypothetical protein